MSIKDMTLAFQTRVGNPLAKLILVKLADHANDDGICWPSIRRIAHDAECSVRSVQRHIRLLEAAGLVKVTRQEMQGVSLPSIYCLQLGGDAVSPPPSGSHRGGVRQSPGGRHADTQTVSEPSSETAAACTAAAGAAPRQIPAGPSAPSGKKRRVRHSGLVTWIPDDETAAELLEQTASSADITAAIESVRKAGLEPVPGRVAREIERLRQRREADAAAQARRAAASTPPADPEAAARGRAFIEARRRLRRAPESP